MTLEKSIQESIKIYLSTHSRSNKKLIPIHSYINKSLTEKLSKSKYKVHSLPEKEIVVEGRYNPKKVDICIKKCNKIAGIGSVKFIMSNYKQNANNYFENCTGELINLRYISKTLFVMIIFDEIPYYDKQHNIKSYHSIDDKDLLKYQKLVTDKYLDDLIIIKVSNGRSLLHPQKITENELKNMDFSKFKILNCFPNKYDKIIKDFTLKCQK